VNSQILLIAIVFGLVETAYFGGNWSPQSTGEVIADGIACLLLALALLR